MGREQEGKNKTEKVHGVNMKRMQGLMTTENKSWRDLGRLSSLKVIVGARLHSESS